MMKNATRTLALLPLLLVAVLMQAARCYSLSIFSLTPLTTPEEIVLAQLVALQKDDMQLVFDFASVGNKAGFQNDLETFDRMVRSATGPYKFLLRHQEAEILLFMKTPSDRWQGLVRVSPQGKDSALKEYFWTLSRCTEGKYKGCFFVDSVIPRR